MPLVMNCSAEEQHTTVFGNHFTFKPGQIKNCQSHIAHFLAIDRRELGFISLPEAFEDHDYMQSKEGQEKLAELKKAGIANRVAKLREVIYNNQVSLKRDLERADIKADPRVFASDGEIKAMEELVRYQQSDEDEEQKKVDRIKELEKKIAKVK